LAGLDTAKTKAKITIIIRMRSGVRMRRILCTIIPL
jgi:hypothetical protein